MKKYLVAAVALLVAGGAALGACGRRSVDGGQARLLDIAQSRGLSPEDAARAVKTFVPRAVATNTCCSPRVVTRARCT